MRRANRDGGFHTPRTGGAVLPPRSGGRSHVTAFLRERLHTLPQIQPRRCARRGAGPWRVSRLVTARAWSGRVLVTAPHRRRQRRRPCGARRRRGPSPASSRHPRQVRGPVRGEHRRGRATGTNGADNRWRRNFRAPSIAVTRNGRRRAQRAAGQASARSTRSVRRREGSQRYRRAAAIRAESPVAKRRARTFCTGIVMAVEQAHRAKRNCRLHPDHCRRVGPERPADLATGGFLQSALRTGRAPFVMHPALQRLSQSQETSSI